MGEISSALGDLTNIKPILQLIFYVLFGFYAIFSAILYYHWTTYATAESVSRVTLLTFAICTLPLLVIMGVIILIV